MKFLTSDDVAKLLGVTRKTVNRWARERQISYIALNSRDRRYTEEHVQAFVESRTHPAPPQHIGPKQTLQPPPIQRQAEKPTLKEMRARIEEICR